MSLEAELPDRPEPRGVVGWLRFGAVIVAGAMLTYLVALFLASPLDALGASWGLPHRMSLGNGVTAGTFSFWLVSIAREWTRPARRFLAAHGLPKSDR